MPSSSASVADTPSSSPVASRRSMSRRCAGVYPARYGESRSAYSRPSRSRAKRWMSSAALRLFAKHSVRSPRSTSSASSRGPSPSALARRFSSSSVTGGFQSTIVRSARGAESSETTVVSSPVNEARAPPGSRSSRRRAGTAVRAVHGREPPQAPQDVADVRAEDAAVHVSLVDDDVLEVREHVAPAVVMGKDAKVEHVRVGEDGVRPRPHLAPLVDRRVAVVDRRAHAGHAKSGEAARLILRERLGR